jgi:hypothetical protein
VVKQITLGFHPDRFAIGGGFAWVGVTKDVYGGTCP